MTDIGHPSPSGPDERTRVVSDAGVLGGQPVVSGTHVPAATILAYLRGGYSAADIRADYPSLPPDGVRAVEVWAERTLGPGWKAGDRPAA